MRLNFAGSLSVGIFLSAPLGGFAVDLTQVKEAGSWRLDRMLTCQNLGPQGQLTGSAQLNIWWDSVTRFAWIAQLNYSNAETFSGSVNMQIQKVNIAQDRGAINADLRLEQEVSENPKPSDQFKKVWHIRDGVAQNVLPSSFRLEREGGSFGNTFKLEVGRNLTDGNAQTDDIHVQFANCSISNASVWFQVNENRLPSGNTSQQGGN